MRKEFYVTTPIFYVNARPHIGHAYTSVAADVLARWHRSRGDEVFFLTGTDEHGTKNYRSATERGEDAKAFVDKIAGTFMGLRETLGLSWDFFIRTSDAEAHWPGAQALWKKLEEAGDIYWKDYEGFYCVGCEAFVTEKELIDGLCPNHKTKPELVQEKNLYFRLSKYAHQIEKAIESDVLEIRPETRKNEVLAFIKGGVDDVSFSRPKEKLDWGIPVPGHEDQVMYVWCDALSNYITAIGYGRDEKKFAKWWPADVHLIGKDILRFHAVIWPGMLLAAGLPLPQKIFAHGFITIEGEKISKSLGNAVDPAELVSRYGSDAVRYYLLREIPSHEDGNYSEATFKERYTADLANGLGNFAARVSTLFQRHGSIEGVEPAHEIKKEITETAARIHGAIDKFKLHEAVTAIWDLIKFGDGYVDLHKPWKTGDQTVIAQAVLLLGAIADFAEPIVPKAAAIIKEGIANQQKIDNLFPRLDA